MPTKIEQGVTNRLDEFCERLLALHGPSATLKGIRALAVEYGITVSNDAASTFRDGPFARHLERLRAGRQMREALTDAVGAGRHPVDAMEDAIALELEDHLTAAEDGKIDIKFVVSQLSKLRLSLSLREESRRKQIELERKQVETAKKLELADQQLRLRDEQIARFEREKSDWEKHRTDAQAALAKAEKKGGVTPDTRKLIEDVMAGRVAA